jgi:hypothetical protein
MLKIYSIFSYIVAGIQVFISLIIIISSAILKGGCSNYSSGNSNICSQVNSYKLPYDIVFGVCLILIMVRIKFLFKENFILRAKKKYIYILFIIISGVFFLGNFILCR